MTRPLKKLIIRYVGKILYATLVTFLNMLFYDVFWTEDDLQFVCSKSKAAHDKMEIELLITPTRSFQIESKSWQFIFCWSWHQEFKTWSFQRQSSGKCFRPVKQGESNMGWTSFFKRVHLAHQTEVHIKLIIWLVGNCFSDITQRAFYQKKDVNAFNKKYWDYSCACYISCAESIVR